MFSLKSYNTFKIDASASAFYLIERVEDLFAISLHEREKACILGGGSNTLFTCDDCGVVLHIGNKGIDAVYEVDNVVLTVAAGEMWNDIVRFAVDGNMWGIENLVDIYGTVGGAAVQNIGAYGSEFKDVVISVDVVDLLSGEKFTLSAVECQYGYRSSIFKRQPHWLVWSVKLGLRVERRASDGISAAVGQSVAIANGTVEEGAVARGGEGVVSDGRSVSGGTPKEIAAQISALRSSKLPPLELYGSAGSFFKNPVITEAQFNAIHAQYPDLGGYPASGGSGSSVAAVGNIGGAGAATYATDIKISAGWLIEKCGFKGVRKGNVGIYEKQALVLINFGNATGAEVLSFAQKIIASVEEKFGITLLSEVVIR
jgi:UDP-N-acetylmuramate dehydrogenase